MSKKGFLFLALGILVVFGLLLAGFHVYPEFKYKYYRGRLEAEDAAGRDAAVKNFLALPPQYRKRLAWDAFKSVYPYSPAAAVVLFKSDDFDYKDLDRDEFLNLIEALKDEWVIKQVPDEFKDNLRKRFLHFRPRGMDVRYCNLWYKVLCLRTGCPPYERVHVFLHIKQAPDGRWMSEDGTLDGDIITTSLAILAYLGNGETHNMGIFKKNVRAGFRFLEKHMKVNGGFSDNTLAQAMSVWAVGEAYAMSLDGTFKKMAEASIRNLIARQLPDGGFPEVSDGDASDPRATFYSVRGLMAAKAGGLDVPREIFKKTKEYLLSLISREKDPHLLAGAAITAIICGCRLNHPTMKPALDTIQQHLPSWDDERDVEYIYWGTFAKNQQGYEPWKEWYKAMKKTLLDNQKKEDHIFAGSWDPVMGPASRKYGRAYTTAMCALALEIYYRYVREGR
jgi:hypothetical protein